MFDVVIPIRSGSKEIKNKNIKKFNRDNLTNLLLKKIINLKDINRIFILTDSTDYKKKIIKHKKINTEYIRLKKYFGIKLIYIFGNSIGTQGLSNCIFPFR